MRRTVRAMTADTPTRLARASAPADSNGARRVPASGRGTRRRLRLPIALVLTLGFGGLMLVAVASVLLLGLITTGRNTSDLLTEKARLLMDGLESRVRSQLDPAQAQIEYLASSMVHGHIDPADKDQLGNHLRTAMAAWPQLTGVGFLTASGDFVSALRQGPQEVAVSIERNVFWAEESLELGRTLGGAVWVDPVWADGLGTSVLTVQMPVRRDGRFIGMLMTGVSFTDLSRFLARVTEETQLRAAILFDDHFVLAHPLLGNRRFDFSTLAPGARPPLPSLEELGDPVISAIWQQIDPEGVPTQGREEMRGRTVDIELDAGRPELGLGVRVATLEGRDYVYLLKRLSDYGAHPWTLAIAFPEEEVVTEFRRMGKLAGVGLAILVVSVLLALLLGRRISRQMKRLASAAVAVRGLDFQSVPPLPDSRFREMSEAAHAFNAMVAGLRWFETYVPKPLVGRLIDRDTTAAGIISEERTVTVLFTDIKGFSALAETLSPQETAAWLNAHFTQVARCIEAEGGTVDKFIGDSVMAFWGAPDDQPDHAARALRAARSLDRLIRAAAAEAGADGLPAICVRIGIHSGPVVVGNIGAASRSNYTIVGDTVNTASRLESLGSSQIGDDCCVVLVSEDTVSAAGPAAGPTLPLGQVQLRGRTGTVEVHRLAAE